MHELIIIGAGPAGMAAAVYAARQRLNTALLSSDVGGQVNWTNGVENYLGYQFIEGDELVSKFQQQVNQFPVDQKIGLKVTLVRKVGADFEVICETGEMFQGKTVILASGKRPRKLGVDGEKELTGRGVNYCSVCDAPDFTDQSVAVIGGGNSAVEAALDITKIAEHVDLVSLTPLTADPVLTEKVSDSKNLTVHTGQQTVQILGQEAVEGIVIRDVQAGNTKRLDVSGVFVEIGLVPNSDMVKDLVTLNDVGEVPVNAGCETELPGLFASGDVTAGLEKQIVIAVGQGARAALQAQRYLRTLPH